MRNKPDHSKPPESARKAAERIIKYVNDSINANPQIVINIMNYYADAQVADLMANLKAENERLKEALTLTKEVNNEYNND